MSAITEPMAAISASVPENPSAAVLIGQIEVEFAKCECCGLTEECTEAYIEGIRRRFDGKWICGLCSEAVQDEVLKSDELITTEEAMAKHMSFCKKFAAAAGPPPDPSHNGNETDPSPQFRLPKSLEVHADQSNRRRRQNPPPDS